ncbi:MAG: lysyl oxidase family protein [Acidobacteriota bacterium]
MKRLALAIFLLSLCTVAFAGDNKNNTYDPGVPDLVVSDNLGSQWVVRTEDFPASFCSVQEGDVDPGTHTVVRFTVTTPNIGTGDLRIGDPNVHVAANDGLYEFASCHNHYHFKHYALYELVDPNSGYVWKAAKRGFCMLDTDPNPAYLGEPARTWQFRSCGAVGIPGNQGISHGWADTYRFFLGGQFFVLDGGDGQPPVPPGTYMLRITVNPPYTPDKKGNCPRTKDPLTGLCHQFDEASYTNNVRTVLINLPDHPGREGAGPLKNEKALTYEPAEHDQ